MQYKIANTLFEIVFDKEEIMLPIYSKFLVFQTDNSVDIRINLLDSKFLPPEYSICKNEHTTHIWASKDEEYILWFSNRSVFLDKCSKKSIWCLVGNKNLNNWKMYIPDLLIMSKENLYRELENRPWLQRLYICYCMNKNEAVMHGAVCNINGEGYLFLGESGAGKSTMCSILEDKFDVYSDDRFIVKLVDDHFVAFGTPWNIKNRKYCSQNSVRINRVYFLSHGNNELNYYENNYALLQALMKQILHSGVYRSTDLLVWKLLLAKKIVERTKCFEFKFVPDKTCLKYIIGDTYDT